jgi:hypothetical protein
VLRFLVKKLKIKMQPMDKAFVVLKKRPVNCEKRLQEEKKDDILQRISNKGPENSMQKVSTPLSCMQSHYIEVAQGGVSSRAIHN